MMTMSQIKLSAGTIDYEDTGGDGPTLVLLHGLLMDASLWDDVMAGLSADHRCVAPTLPLEQLCCTRHRCERLGMLSS